MHNLDPAALACLAAIVDEGSFEGAAQTLAITQSAVSHRLKALESAVGQPMLVRSRPLVLTQTGKLLLRYARQLNAMQVDLARDLSHNERVLDQRIPIAVNADSLATWIPHALNPVVQRGIRLEILVDDQDFTHEWLKQGSVLGCVSTVAHALQGCTATPLGSMRYVAAASPKLAKAISLKGFSAQTLAEHPFLVFNRKDDMQRQWAARALGLKRVKLLETFVPSTEASVRAMLLGWGIGVAPELLLAPLIAKGQLVAIEPDSPIDIELYWHRWSVSSTTLDWIGDALIAGKLS
jgi:LysR family transcriptional regulator, chromosome initiation inhibitor